MYVIIFVQNSSGGTFIRGSDIVIGFKGVWLVLSDGKILILRLLLQSPIARKPVQLLF